MLRNEDLRLILEIIGIILTVVALLSDSIALGLIGVVLFAVVVGATFLLRRQQRRQERSWSEPNITLLELDSVLRFRDKDADHVHRIEYRKAVANYPGITEFWVRGIARDGRIENVLIDDEPPHFEVEQVGDKERGKRFANELELNEPFDVKVSYDMIESFRGNPEFFILQVRTLTGRLRLRFEFHEAKPCTGARAYVQPTYRRTRRLQDDEAQTRLSKDGRALDFTIADPELGADYRFEWDW